MAGTCIEVPTLDEMPRRHPSTLSFRPKNHSERKLQEGDSTLSPQQSSAYFTDGETEAHLITQ